MKIRIQRRAYMLHAINWYQEQLTGLIKGPFAYSEAQKEVLRIHLKHIQQNKQFSEKSTHWFVPVQVEFEDNGLFRVALVDPNEVLFLDD